MCLMYTTIKLLCHTESTRNCNSWMNKHTSLTLVSHAWTEGKVETGNSILLQRKWDTTLPCFLKLHVQ